MSTREEKLEAFGRLIDIIDELREKCPWDAKQTMDSLRPNTIEEVFELSQAILSKSPAEVRKELGDVAMHVVFYAKIGEEQGSFDLKDVCDGVCEKLIYRHPHVFGTLEVKDAHEVEQNWEQLKLKEKGGNRNVMSGVPTTLPPLIKAFRIQEKAVNSGFDWEHREDVWGKVYEKLDELKAEIDNPSATLEAKEGELGDFIFSLINMARLYDLQPDTALERTCSKFVRRFTYMEEKAQSKGRRLKEMTLAEMEEYWQEAKEKE